MKRVTALDAKPNGWYWILNGRWIAHGDSKNPFRWGVYGGSLRLPREGFREWFFRIPIIGSVVTIGHIR